MSLSTLRKTPRLLLLNKSVLWSNLIQCQSKCLRLLHPAREKFYDHCRTNCMKTRADKPDKANSTRTQSTTTLQTLLRPRNLQSKKPWRTSKFRSTLKAVFKSCKSLTPRSRTSWACKHRRNNKENFTISMCEWRQSIATMMKSLTSRTWLRTTPIKSWSPPFPNSSCGNNYRSNETTSPS